jgi:hypothetical protein
MTDAERLTCQSCNQPKSQLTRTKSKLTGWALNLCSDCIRSDYEPRFLIIMAIRHFGINPIIEKYIRRRLYVGEDILAADIL